MRVISSFSFRSAQPTCLRRRRSDAQIRVPNKSVLQRQRDCAIGVGLPWFRLPDSVAGMTARSRYAMVIS
jgi:hypothetical protein